jgi:glycosyltransferase involved in cell wall biosynthesis
LWGGSLFRTPRVSVIIPTYNRLELLSNAISSVIRQTFEDFEIIIVDDASTSDIQSVVSRFSDPRIHLLNHFENGGEAVARNTGLAAAKADLIAFLDDDDEWMPEKLARQVELLESSPPEIAATYTAFLWFNWPERELVGSRTPPSTNGNFGKTLLKRNIVGTPSTVMIRKKCLEKVGVFDSSIAYGVDHDLWMRIGVNYKFQYIPEYLVKCHVHENRLTNNLDILIQGQRDMLKKYPAVKSEYKSYHSRRCLSIGEKLCLNNDLKRGRRMLVSSLQFEPLNWRCYFDLFLLTFGYTAFLKGRKVRQNIGRYLRKKISSKAATDPIFSPESDTDLSRIHSSPIGISPATKSSDRAITCL